MPWPSIITWTDPFHPFEDGGEILAGIEPQLVRDRRDGRRILNEPPFGFRDFPAGKIAVRRQSHLGYKAFAEPADT